MRYINVKILQCFNIRLTHRFIELSFTTDNYLLIDQFVFIQSGMPLNTIRGSLFVTCLECQLAKLYKIILLLFLSQTVLKHYHVLGGRYFGIEIFCLNYEICITYINNNKQKRKGAKL